MRILFLSQDIGSKEMGMGYRSYMFARQLKSRGHHVQLVTAAHSHVRRQNPERNSWHFQKEIEGLDYHFLGCFQFGGSLALRALNMLYFSFKAWLLAPSFARSFQPDVVVASSPHPLVIFAGYRMAKKSGARLVFEVRDIWPLSITKSSKVNPTHPFVRLIQFAEDYAYRKADLVVSLLSNAYEHMKTRGLKENKYVFIPNGYDPNDFSNPEPLNSQTKNDLEAFKNKFSETVAYTGAHGIMNQLDHLILAAKELPEVGFILLGNGPEKQKLQQLAKDENTSNVLFLESVPKPQVSDFLSQVDIAYIGLMDSDLFEFGISPNKLIDYMMAEKPIVMAIQTKNDPVEKSGCGVKCDNSKPDSIAAGIRQILNIPLEERETMGEMGKGWLEDNLNYDSIITRFEKSLQD